MALIRTQRIVVGRVENPNTGATVDTPVWTCPASTLAVVRHIDAASAFMNLLGDPVAGGAWAGLEANGGDLLIFAKMDWTGQLPMATELLVAAAQWRGTCVLYPGDTLWIGTDRQYVDYQVSGALLPY